MGSHKISSFKTILALDTAMSGCNVAVCSGENCFSRAQLMMRGQAEHLVPMVQAVMEEAGREFSDLDAVLTTIGPGAFTGLRIGMSTAKSLGLALNIPVFGMTTLQALALPMKGRALAVVIETKRDDFYFQMFDAQGHEISDALSVSAGEIKDSVAGQACSFVGDALARLQEEAGKDAFPGADFENVDMPDLCAATRALTEKPDLFARNPQPVYLRAPDVSAPKKPGRVIAAR